MDLWIPASHGMYPWAIEVAQLLKNGSIVEKVDIELCLFHDLASLDYNGKFNIANIVQNCHFLQ